jgi:hypothetical protein
MIIYANWNEPSAACLERPFCVRARLYGAQALQLAGIRGVHAPLPHPL